MLFNSWEFILLFLPVVLVTALRLRGNLLLFWICLSSFVFYAYAGKLWFIIPMVVTTVFDYGIGMLIERAPFPLRKKGLLVLSLSCNLGLLAYFKYSPLFPDFKIFRLALDLPPGISFYTFQSISYVVDVYKGKTPAEKNFLKYVGFITFFPHLVVGPLTRYNQLIPQLSKIAAERISPLWSSAALIFSIGLIKKVMIADRIGAIIDPMIGSPETLGLSTAWVCLLGYTVQIYFDFSGYADMAIGLGRLFGIELPENFNSPYQAVNPSDYWKRWHITLSQWLRDYLYIPLGGNRKGRWRQYFNLTVTMVLGGLWHGANYTFVIWGFYQGLFLIAYKLWQPQWDRQNIWFQRGLTFFLVAMGRVMFRVHSAADAFVWYKSLFGLQGFGPRLEFSFSIWMIPIGLYIAVFFKNSSTWSFESMPRVYRVAFATATAVAFLMINYSSRFLYYKF